MGETNRNCFFSVFNFSVLLFCFADSGDDDDDRVRGNSTIIVTLLLELEVGKFQSVSIKLIQESPLKNPKTRPI